MLILTVGLHPSAIDYSRTPGLDEATLTARIEAGRAALEEAGFETVGCQITTDLDEAERAIRECVALHPIEAAMIGGGVRMVPENTALFERAVNVLIELVPGIRFGFNTSPETTVDALRRLSAHR